MGHILALDQGTSSSRAIVFNDAGQIKSTGQREFDLILPQAGWVEQDPEVLWATTLSSAREALKLASLEASEISAIGITNQRETTLVWERDTGRPVYNAIVWQDRRTAERCAELSAAGYEPLIREKTGLVIDPYFSASKIAWILDHAPSLRDRAAAGELCFGTVDSYLIWRLTGGVRHVTDATNAARTQLFNIVEQRWDSALLDLFGVPEAMLPEVLDSAADFGSTQADWLGASVPVTGVAGDQQAALVGQACFSPGMSKSTYGTGCFVMTNTGAELRRSEHGLLGTVAYRVGGRTHFALEGSIFVAGQAVKWLRDQLGLIDSAAATEALCRSTGGDTQGVYLGPAFTGLGAPHWRPDARALLTGMTLDADAAHVVTATVASVAYQSHDLLTAMAADGAPVASLRVDGGMVVNDWLCQFLADILDCSVARPQVTETTALGAASLAALGAGWVSELSDTATFWQSDQMFSPTMVAADRAAKLSGWTSAVAQVLAGCKT